MTNKVTVTDAIYNDGNIFAVMATATRALKRAGKRAEADELVNRVTSCGSYHEALAIVFEYVEVEYEDDDEEYDDEEYDDDEE